ncbi:Crp/Fnr family transcriptional regulator [Hoeflea sp.]|uniref:Crp/Fnr family transcriptional regulator n=1 Tax=Hoeflea sp. TaxID=1940281 RepID=UPI003A9362BD
MALSVEFSLWGSSKSLAGRSWPLFGDHESVEFLLEVSSRLHQYAPGSVITFEGQNNACVICVLGGWISLSKTLENGQTQIIDFVLPGDITFAATADGLTSQCTIIAQTSARLAIFSFADWEKMEKDIEGLTKLVRSLESAAHARLSERYLRMGKGDARMRIAYALLEFFVRLTSHSVTGPVHFHIPLRQQQLGDFTGVSSVHVCRTLKGFCRLGILAVQNHMDITIKNPVALAEIAQVSIQDLRLSITPLNRQ